MHYPAISRMALWMNTPDAKAHYRRRKTIPEPVFGWIKQVLGFRFFSLRGFGSCRRGMAAHLHSDELKAYASTGLDPRMIAKNLVANTFVTGPRG